LFFVVRSFRRLALIAATVSVAGQCTVSEMRSASF
jgi:hypothetical protein